MHASVRRDHARTNHPDHREIEARADERLDEWAAEMAQQLAGLEIDQLMIIKSLCTTRIEALRRTAPKLARRRW